MRCVPILQLVCVTLIDFGGQHLRESPQKRGVRTMCDFLLAVIMHGQSATEYMSEKPQRSTWPELYQDRSKGCYSN